MGIDKLPSLEERNFYRGLITELWILFDDNLRAVKGVKIDVDVSGIDPIHLHPYRWSPMKCEAGKCLLDGFLKDGIITPSVSEWSFPASLVPKPNNATEFRLVVDLRELNKSIPLDR